MTLATEDVVKAAMALPQKERADAAAKIIDSLETSNEEVDPAEIDAAWIAETKRRSQAYQRGEMGSVPIEDVLERLRKKA